MTGDNYKQAIGSKNCMQCAAAYMLGLPLAAVPDFEKAGPDAWESFKAFFAALGFTTEMLPPNLELLGDYLASGESERGTSHMVVMRDGKLLHDPHPSNAGLAAIQVVWVIARRAGPGKMVRTLRGSPEGMPLYTAPPQPAEPVQEPAPMPPFPPVPQWKRGCAVCGLGADGKAYGYACPRSDCPTRITCGGTV